MKIAVGSLNPVKIKAVKQGFELVYPSESITVEGFDVSSGVSNQPMSDEESIEGAENRAKNALKLSGFDFGVGLEGGLQKIANQWYTGGWMVIVDSKGNKGIGCSIKMHVPDKIMDVMLKDKIELGYALDKVFKTENIKQKGGYFGLMTNDIIGRTDGYREAVITALASFINPDIFFKDE